MQAATSTLQRSYLQCIMRRSLQSVALCRLPDTVHSAAATKDQSAFLQLICKGRANLNCRPTYQILQMPEPVSDPWPFLHTQSDSENAAALSRYSVPAGHMSTA